MKKKRGDGDYEGTGCYAEETAKHAEFMVEMNDLRPEPVLSQDFRLACWLASASFLTHFSLPPLPAASSLCLGGCGRMQAPLG